MKFNDLPKSWRGINLSIEFDKKVADLTNEYKIFFNHNNISNESSFQIPKIENNRFYLNGNKYIVWYRICKPICSIEYIDNIHTVNIHNILTRPDRTENYDIKFYIKDNIKLCEYKNNIYEIDNTYLHDIFYSYWITNLDRKDLNIFIDSNNNENYITYEDINKIFEIIEENKDYTTNWKEICYLRVINLEDLIISTLMLALPATLKDFFDNKINKNIITNNIRTFLATDAPEIRIDLNETEIASYAQNKKVILPFNNYCDVNDLIPDKSWYNHIDFLDSPQSIKVGSVASFTNNIEIKNRKINLYESLV